MRNGARLSHLDARFSLIVILSRGRAHRSPRFYDLISSSTLTFDRVRSFTGPEERSNSPRSPSIHLRERAQAIPVDRFFVVDAQPRIKSRESWREAGRGIGCHRSRSSCNRTEKRQTAARSPSPPSLPLVGRRCICYESTDLMFYDRPWNQTVRCLRCGCTGSRPLAVRFSSSNRRSETKRARFSRPWKPLIS